MKTKVMYLATKVMVAVILVVIIAVKTLAGEAPKLKLIPHSTNQAIVIINNNENSPSELVIEDMNGNLSYYKEGRIDEKMYTKLFNFKNLDNGTYKITASNNSGKKEVTFKVTDNGIKVEMDNYSANRPFIEVEDNILKLSFLNHSLNEIYLSIANVNGEIYKRSLGNDFSITTGINLTKLNYGDYAAVISDGENTYSYNFEK